MSAPLFQMHTVSMILDSTTRMKTSKIILYIKEEAGIAKYCKLSFLPPSVHSCMLINVKCVVQSCLETAFHILGEISQTSNLLQKDFILSEVKGWLQYFKLTPSQKNT